MNIIFRVDSSNKIGIGHLMRCLTLADALREKNYKITFICRDLIGNLIDLIRRKGYKVIVLLFDVEFKSNSLYLDWLGATQGQDAQQTIQSLSDSVDLLVVDSYALDKKWHVKLKAHVVKILVIDDLADRDFDCDILLNQNLGSKRQDYQGRVPDGCQLLLGRRYVLLRPEFLKLRKASLVKRDSTRKIKNVFVSMGGSDNNNITYNVLQQLDSELNIVVVLGEQSPHNKTIQNYAKNRNIEVITGTDNMAELMLEADVAIGTSGSTSWERCCLGLPTLLYIVADNQRKIAEELEQFGAIMIVQNLKDDLQKITHDLTLWKFKSDSSKNVCDGLGVGRIVEALWTE